MLRCALPLAFSLGLFVAGAEADELKEAPRSPLREQMREALKAKVLAKPSETPKPEAKSADNPIVIVLPAFIVEDSREKQERRASVIVDGQKAMEERLSYHPLFKNDRVEILHRPRLDDFSPPPGGRLKLDILQLKW